MLILDGVEIPRFTSEFWTSKQRQASSLHEVSYRACFKPQLPRYFIDRLTQPDDIVYDPFMGRGTTLIEAALLGRRVIGNDANPLSRILTRPRLHPPLLQEVARRIDAINTDRRLSASLDLSMFYHPRTEKEILALRHYLMARVASGKEDDIDRWIRMVATNRLTGHSRGFFSVYTLPPNQAMSQENQRNVNRKRGRSTETGRSSFSERRGFSCAILQKSRDGTLQQSAGKLDSSLPAHGRRDPSRTIRCG
jgi:hypothetical protein